METSDSSETMDIEDPNAQPDKKEEEPAYIDLDQKFGFKTKKTKNWVNK